tara:strand:- start:94 stop:345 length:252 start_codon:yes stop_codon:yes gene_type:complete
MGVLTGKITEIIDMSQGVHIKNEITIKTNSGIAYIECRGPFKRLSDEMKIGDEVIVEHGYNGRVSKNSGTKHNNLPAISIKKI